MTMIDKQTAASDDGIHILVEVREHLGRVYQRCIVIGDRLDKHLQDDNIISGSAELHSFLHRLRMVIRDTVHAMHATRVRAGIGGR